MSLSNAGFSIGIVGQPTRNPNSQFGDIEVIAINPSAGRLNRIITGYVAIGKAVRKCAPKIVHFHDPELIFLGLFLRLFGINVIYDVHEDLPRQILRKHWIPVWLRPVISKIVEKIELLAAGQFSAIVAATPHIGARFNTKTKVAVIANLPSRSELSAWRTIPAKRDKTTLVYIGGLSVPRGLQNMLSVVQTLNTLGRECRLVLAGKFDSENDKKIFEAHPGRKFVDFRGWVDRQQVGQILSQAGIALLLLEPYQSYRESLPIKLYEYVGVGLPCVASNFDVWKAEFGAYKNVHFVDTNNLDEICQLVMRMQDHYGEVLEISAEASQLVPSWDDSASALIALYRSVLASSAT